MIITTKGKNALKLMVDLALYQGENYVKLRDIARRQKISDKYLEQIVSYLHKARKVKSSRGSRGGYRLVKEPKDYTIGEILKAVEGNLVVTDCLYGDENTCDRKDQCFCYPLWFRLNEAVDSILEYTTLQDVVHWEEEIKKDRSVREYE